MGDSPEAALSARISYTEMEWGVTRNGERFGIQTLLVDGQPVYARALEGMPTFILLDSYGRPGHGAPATDIVPGASVGGLEWIQHMRNSPRPWTDSEHAEWTRYQDAALEAARAYLAGPTPELLQVALRAREEMWGFAKSLGWVMTAPRSGDIPAAPKAKHGKKRKAA